MPQSFEAAWEAAESGPDQWLANPTTETLPDELAGDRIVVTGVGGGDQEPALYVGATGMVTDTTGSAVLVLWDDARLNARGLALLRGIDHWQVQAA